MSVSGLWYAGVFCPLKIFELGRCCFRSPLTIPQQSPVASRGFLPCPVVSRLATLHASTPAILILNQIDLPRFSFLSLFVNRHCRRPRHSISSFLFFLFFLLTPFLSYSSLCCSLVQCSAHFSHRSLCR